MLIADPGAVKEWWYKSERKREKLPPSERIPNSMQHVILLNKAHWWSSYGGIYSAWCKRSVSLWTPTGLKNSASLRDFTFWWKLNGEIDGWKAWTQNPLNCLVQKNCGLTFLDTVSGHFESCIWWCELYFAVNGERKLLVNVWMEYLSC
jgi:hypothetical protein